MTKLLDRQVQMALSNCTLSSDMGQACLGYFSVAFWRIHSIIIALILVVDGIRRINYTGH
jgi:hypothetical protein